MFHPLSKKSPTKDHKPLKDLIKIKSAQDILSDKKRQTLLSRIRDNCGLEPKRYNSLCDRLIENLVSYYQELPETSNHLYAQPGGLLDHALNRTEAAMGLFQSFVKLEKSQTLSDEQCLWQYALLSAALIQGVGKLYIDYDIQTYDAKGHFLKQWNPLTEPLSETGTHYSYAFEKESHEDFRKRLNLLLAQDLMPASGYEWIASQPEVLKVWLALLNEDERSAGTLGAILIRAEAIAIQRYLAEFLKHHQGGRGGKYGRVGGFIDKSKRNITDKEQLAGIEFIHWLMEAMEKGEILMNSPPLFMVPGGMLISPDMFKLFVRAHPDFKNWQAVQNGFLSLGLHEIGANGEVTTRFEQPGSKKFHEGVVLQKYAVALPDQAMVMDLITGKVQTQSAMQVIHSKEHHNQFIRSHTAPPPGLPQELSSSGQWEKTQTSDTPSQQPSATHRG